MQQVVDVFDVVERVVLDETQLRHHAHLVTDTVAQQAADGLGILAYLFYDLLLLIHAKHAQIHPRIRLVGSNIIARHGNHQRGHFWFQFLLEYIA